MTYFYPAAEYVRPWKLASLACGIAILVLGSIFTPAPDWDIPVSLLMAAFAYGTAPCSLRVLLERRWRQLPIAAFFTWWTVDGCYALYWHFRDPAALDLMRSANAPASLGLYGLCGVAWLYRGSLGQLLADARAALRSR
jgi:hypothetical protein